MGRTQTKDGQKMTAVEDIWASTEVSRRLNKGRFTLCVTFPFRRRSIFVPSDRSVFTMSVVFSHLPTEHVIGSPRLSPSNMQPHSFSKRQQQ